jgi:hypothetical protein
VALDDLLLDLGVDLVVGSPLQELGGLVVLVGFLQVLLGLPVEVEVAVLAGAEVVLGDVLAEAGGVKSHDGILGQTVGSGVLVVLGVIDDVLDLRLIGDALGSTVKVPDLSSQSSILEVSSDDCNFFNSFLAELSVGGEYGGF